MKKNYFPIFIDLSDKNIVVIGGGTIAGRRAATLCEFAEHVCVIAPEISDQVEKLVSDGKVLWIKDCYQSSYVENADLVVAATDVPEVNHKVKEDCMRLEKEKNRKIFVSVADDRSLCDFYFPGIVKTEDAVIGISSGGSPKHTKELRQKLEEILKKESQ